MCWGKHNLCIWCRCVQISCYFTNQQFPPLSDLPLLCTVAAAPAIFTLFDMLHAPQRSFMMLSLTSSTPHPSLHLWAAYGFDVELRVNDTLCRGMWMESLLKQQGLGSQPARNGFLKWNLEIGKLIYQPHWAKHIQGDLRRRMADLLQNIH